MSNHDCPCETLLCPNWDCNRVFEIPTDDLWERMGVAFACPDCGRTIELVGDTIDDDFWTWRLENSDEA